MIRALMTLTAVGLLIPSMAAQAQSSNDESHFAGIVLAVDTDHGILVVEEASAEGPERRFRVIEQAEIQKNGQRIALKDVAVGDPVSITYVDDDKARTVEILTPPTTSH